MFHQEHKKLLTQNKWVWSTLEKYLVPNKKKNLFYSSKIFIYCGYESNHIPNKDFGFVVLFKACENYKRLYLTLPKKKNMLINKV